MEKITNKKILTIFTLCILIFVPFMKHLSLFLVHINILEWYDSLNPAIVIYISIPFLVYVYVGDVIKSKRKLDLYDYIFFALIITGLISTIFSIDKYISIFGKECRHEGFLSVLGYYLLFINWKVNGTREDAIKFIKLLVIIAVINSIYALLQIYTSFDFILRYPKNPHMAYGLCENPNFFGSLIVTVISIVTCYFFIHKKVLLKLVLIILLYISLINSQSTGPFLTYILVILFLIVFLYKKQKIILKNVLLLFIVLIFTYFAVYYLNKNIYKSEKCEMCEIDKTIESGGNGRLEIWKNSIDVVKNNFLVGVGFDNFYLEYPNPEIDTGVSFTIENNEFKETYTSYYYIIDNAHNVYLHNLATYGILGIIPYLTLCLLTFLKGLRSKDKIIFVLISGFVAYSIQAFANLSVIQVAPIYFIIIGLILSEKQSHKNSSYIN